MQNKYQELNLIMVQLIQFFEEFTDLLQKKIEILCCNDMKALEDVLKQEQVFSLRIRGLEAKRKNAFDHLNITLPEFKNMISQPQTMQEAQMAKTYWQLNQQVEQYRQKNDVAKAQIELHLHAMKRILNTQEEFYNPYQNFNDTELYTKG